MNPFCRLCSEECRLTFLQGPAPSRSGTGGSAGQETAMNASKVVQPPIRATTTRRVHAKKLAGTNSARLLARGVEMMRPCTPTVATAAAPGPFRCSAKFPETAREELTVKRTSASRARALATYTAGCRPQVTTSTSGRAPLLRLSGSEGADGFTSRVHTQPQITCMPVQADISLGLFKKREIFLIGAVKVATFLIRLRAAVIRINCCFLLIAYYIWSAKRFMTGGFVLYASFIKAF